MYLIFISKKFKSIQLTHKTCIRKIYEISTYNVKPKQKNRPFNECDNTVKYLIYL